MNHTLSHALQKAALLCAAAGLAIHAQQAAVTTYHNDLARTGLNSSETVLTPANVNVASFGKLFSLSIDGQTNAQPLYVPSLAIPGKGVHNVIFVVTEHDSVYAFDADTSQPPLWKATLLDAAHGAAPGAIPEPVSDLGNCGDIPPEVGIVGTPVIDTGSNTIYLVGKTNENGVPVQRLHALDITTGLEKPNSPVVIQATVPGTGSGSSGGQLAFDPKWSIQRPGLLLLNGYVYIGFASHCDFATWHGWMMSYNATSLQLASAVAMTPNTTGSGVWMSGGAPAGETVNGVSRVFVSTGNGTFDANNDYGNDIIRIEATNGVMSIKDHFTPRNQATLEAADADVSSGGVLLLPDQTAGGHPHLLVLAGKEGRIYVIDRDAMSGFSATQNNIVQDLVNSLAGLWATPSFFNNTVYFWGCSFQGSPVTESLRAWSLSNGLLSTSSIAHSTRTSLFPGSILSISSRGTTNGIVWGALADQYTTGGNGLLVAYDASNVASELWNSDQNAARDSLGQAVKFTVPTIANGKVYATNVNQLNVFGLLSTSIVAPTFTPVPGTYNGSVNVTFSNTTNAGASIYYTLDGSTPTTSSTLYSSAINITATTTIKAITSVPGLGISPVTLATYTITPMTGTNFTLSSFATAPMLLNGNASSGSALTLTSGLQYETSSAYYSVKLPVSSFSTSFTFQIQNPKADGMTFVIQNLAPTALGHGGGGLGYSGLDRSVAIKFDLYNNAGEGINSTGIFTNGKSPTTPAQDLTSLGIDLHSGHTMTAALSYDGTTLTMVLTDLITTKSTTLSWSVNIPTTIGATTAYFGFTGASGALTCTSLISNWSYSSAAPAAPPTKPAPSPVLVNLAGYFNHFAIADDTNSTPLPGSLDGAGGNYSSQLLGRTATWSGLTWNFGPGSVPDAVTNKTITLPSGSYSTLKFLGTGLNGQQLSQKFTVTYSDNSTSVVTLNLSDWISSKQYAGEEIVSAMAYHDTSGQKTSVPTWLYGYTISLDPTKTVTSITLPTTNNVAVMALAMIP